MSENPPKCVVDAGFKVIFDGNVFEYVGIGWLVVRDATPQDYETIPQVID